MFDVEVTRMVKAAMARFYRKLAKVQCADLTEEQKADLEGRDFDPLPRSHRVRWWRDQMDSADPIEFKSAGATRKR